MEEEEAHRLYTLFQRVNEGAKHKQGLGFGERKASPPHHGSGAPGGFLSSFVRATTGFGSEQAAKATSFAPPQYDSDEDVPAAKRLRQQRLSSTYQDGSGAAAASGRPLSGSFGDRLGAQRPTGKEASDRHGAVTHRGPAGASGRGPSGGEPGHSRTGRQEADGAPSGRRGEGDRGRGGSGSGAGAARVGGAKAGGGKGPPDYASLVPGYEDMNPAEKLRARTRIALAQADARIRSNAADADAAPHADSGRGGDGVGGASWTRFVFNSDAHLDEDGGRPSLTAWDGDGDGQAAGAQKRYNSHGLGEDLDVGELNALTFRRTGDVERRQQALRRAEAEHEKAIFGSKLPPPPPLPPAAPPAEAAASRPKPPAAAEQQQQRQRGEDRERGRGGGGQAREREQERGRRREDRREQEADGRRDRERKSDSRQEREGGDRLGGMRDGGRERRAEREERDRHGDRSRDRERDREGERERERRREGRPDRAREESNQRKGSERDPGPDRDRDRDRERRERGGEREARRGAEQQRSSGQKPPELAGPGRAHGPSGRDKRQGTEPGAVRVREQGRSAHDGHQAQAEEADAVPGRGSGAGSGADAGAEARTVSAPAPEPPTANVWRRGGEWDADGPVVVDLDEAGALAAERAAAGLGAESGGAPGGRAGQSAIASLPPQNQQLAETLSSAVLGQQGLSWRERALQARRKAAG